VSGAVDAADRKGALRALAGMKLRPVSIDAAKQDAAAAAQEAFEGSHDFFGQKNVEGGEASEKKGLFHFSKSSNVIALSFMQNLLILLQSGMTLGDSLKL